MPSPTHPTPSTRSRDALVVVCALTAGVHAALTPAHLREQPLLGIGFAVSAVLLAGAAAALLLRPESVVPVRAAAGLLGSLIVAYALTRAAHVPGLAETPEPLDTLGVATKLVEAVGLLLALRILSSERSIQMPAVPRAIRPLPLAAAGLIATFVALAVLVLSSTGSVHAATTPAVTDSPKAVHFQAQMRKLWEDHITWTRMVIVDFAAGLPDLSFAEARLLRNQTDIGNAIKPYYGAAAGNALTKLLRTHILEAVPVLKDAKAGDKEALATALDAWYRNGNQIAAFLTKANPHNWPLSATRSMMRMHLDLTTKEAVSRLQGKWAADIAAYDAVHREILEMADALSSGIVAQFPGRFS